MAITQECCEQYWTSPGGNTPQSPNYMATYLPSRKTIQVRRTRHTGHCWRSRDKLISDVLLWTPHIWPRKSRMTSSNIHTYSSYVRIQDVALKTCRRSGERGSRMSRANGTTWWWWWWLPLEKAWIHLFLFFVMDKFVE